MTFEEEGNQLKADALRRRETSTTLASADGGGGGGVAADALTKGMDAQISEDGSVAAQLRAAADWLEEA